MSTLPCCCHLQATVVTAVPLPVTFKLCDPGQVPDFPGPQLSQEEAGALVCAWWGEGAGALSQGLWSTQVLSHQRWRRSVDGGERLDL